MDRIRIEEGTRGVDLVLARGRGNAMDEAMLVAIEAAFERLASDGAPAVVLRSEAGSFCTGLDLEEAAGRSRAGMRELMVAFHRALRAAFVYRGPVVAAIEGHALAGGALLALTCDHRVMAREAGRFGVHGIQLGVAYPDVAVAVVSDRLVPREQRRLLYEGRLLRPGAALARGWIDEIVAPGRPIPAARDWIASRPALEAFAAHKRRVRAPAAARIEAIDDDGMRRWLDRWFDPDTTRRREEALHALRERDRPRPGEDPAHHDEPRPPANGQTKE